MCDKTAASKNYIWTRTFLLLFSAVIGIIAYKYEIFYGNFCNKKIERV